MFGVANQLLACAALAVATTILLREAPRRVYALVTVLPLVFVATTTISAAVMSISIIYLPMTRVTATRSTGLVDTGVTLGLPLCIWMVLAGQRRSLGAHAASRRHLGLERVDGERGRKWGRRWGTSPASAGLR